MKIIRPLLLMLLLFGAGLLFGGCSALFQWGGANRISGTTIPADALSEIKIGVTRRAKIVGRLGPPATDVMIPDGSSMVTYNYEDINPTTTEEAGNVIAAKAKLPEFERIQTFTVIFDQAGVVKYFHLWDTANEPPSSTNGPMGSSRLFNSTSPPLQQGK